MTTIKITELTDIGANLATSSLVPVVNMAGVPVTQKTNIGNIANVILVGAGVDYPEATVALIAQTVSNAAQPNITSVGTLTNVTVSGNASINGNITANGTAYVGNLSTTGIASITTLSVGTTANLGAVGNVKITGGVSGYVLQTDGAGNLTWTAQTGGGGNGVPGGSNTQVQFNNAGSFGGEADFTYDFANNILNVIRANASYLTAYESVSTANLSANGLATIERINVTNTANLGAVGNVTITGGANGQVLTTNGSGGLSWTTVSGGGGANTGNVTFDDINIIGTGNLHLQPDPANSGSYLDIFLTSGPDLHLVASASANLILGEDDGANVMTSWNGDVAIQSWDTGTNTQGGVWTFDSTGNLQTAGDIVGPASANFTLYANGGVHEFIFADDGTFYAPDNVVLGGNAIYIGPGANTLTGTEHAVLIASSNHFAYIQGVINNVSDNGSADWVAQGHLGSDDGGWADIGFTSDGFGDANYTITGQGDGYVFAQSYYSGQAPGGRGGNLVLATGENGTDNDIIFGTGGFLIANIFGRISNSNNSFELSRTGASLKFPDGSEQTTAYTGGGGNTGNVTFDDVTVQGVNGLNLSAGADFTANLAYLQVRAGDVPSHIHLDTGNNEAYDLIVGDDQKYVQVSSTGNIILSSYDSNTNQYTWTLDTTGNLILAGGNSVIQSIANSSLDPTLPNVSTMVFTPDTNYNSQVLVLDPTAPGHIHLRAYAFSNIDEPAANIFLGGEDTAFEITSGANNEARIHSGGNTWTFGNDGRLTFPGTPRIDTSTNNFEVQAAEAINFEANTVVNIYTDAGNTTYQWQFGDDGNLTLPDTTGVLANVSITLEANDTGNITGLSLIGDSNANLYAHGNVTIVSDSSNTTATWSFVNTGDIVLPNDVVIGDDGSNGMMLSVPTVTPGTYSDWTFDQSGNLTLPTGGQIIVSGGLVSSGASPAPTINGFSITNSVGISGNGNIAGNNISATGNVTAQGVGTNMVRRANTISGSNTAVTLDNLTALVGGTPKRLYIGAATSNMTMAGQSQTMSTGALAVSSWINVPIVTGTGNGFAMSGAITNDGDTAVLNVTDQGAGSGTWRVTGMIANTSANLYSVSIERLA